MATFSQAVKYLTHRPIRLPSANEVSQYGLRDGSHSDTRVIDRLYTVLTLPAYYFPYFQVGAPPYIAHVQFMPSPRLLFQYSLTTTSTFRILKVPAQESNGMRSGLLAVKFREGSSVKRYTVAVRSFGLPDPRDKLFFEEYSGQEIKENCVFEYWFTGTSAIWRYPGGLTKDFPITLNWLSDPVDQNQLNYFLSGPQPIPYYELAEPWDEVIPTDQETLIYLDNP